MVLSTIFVTLMNEESAIAVPFSRTRQKSWCNCHRSSISNRVWPQDRVRFWKQDTYIFWLFGLFWPRRYAYENLLQLISIRVSYYRGCLAELTNERFIALHPAKWNKWENPSFKWRKNKTWIIWPNFKFDFLIVD